jgi:hypothetical protein
MDFSDEAETVRINSATSDVCLVIRNWPKIPFDELVVSSWFPPGETVFWQDLIKRGLSVDKLFTVPLPLLCVSVRSRDSLDMFHVNFIKDLSDDFSTVQILFSPWVHQLEPAYCEIVGLDANRLVADGLNKKHVKKLFWPLSRWEALFGLKARHIETLKIGKMYLYFKHLEDDVNNTIAVDSLRIDI